MLGPDVDSEPQTYAIHYGIELFRLERTKMPHEPDGGHSDDTLCIKTARTQKGYRHSHLKPCPSKTCGVWNHRDQRPIRFGGGYAEHQAETNLRGQPEIHQPDLTAMREFHSCASARSNSWKIKSAACVKSSSDRDA